VGSMRGRAIGKKKRGVTGVKKKVDGIVGEGTKYRKRSKERRMELGDIKKGKTGRKRER
jgi:hypothetical protein